MAQLVLTLASTPSGSLFAVPPKDSIQFEELLSSISTQLIALGKEGVGFAIGSALDLIRCFFQADRCGLLVKDNLGTLHAPYASYSEGTLRISAETDLTRLYPWCLQRERYETC